MVNKEGITMDLNQVLIEAAKDGNMFVLKAALEKGADIDATDRSGRTALIYAAKREHKEIIDFFKEKGVKKEEIDFWITYFKSDEQAKTIDDYTRQIELDAKYVDAYKNRGYVYGNLEEYQKAIDDYYQAGILYLKQKDKTRAQKYIDWMKKIDSSSPLIDKLQNQLEQM
jgi:tetratricopeptide (TPR) repeat protein